MKNKNIKNIWQNTKINRFELGGLSKTQLNKGSRIFLNAQASWVIIIFRIKYSN